jgi:hypothetical protein
MSTKRTRPSHPYRHGSEGPRGRTWPQGTAAIWGPLITNRDECDRHHDGSGEAALTQGGESGMCRLAR